MRQKTKKSLSALVENYFNLIATKESEDEIVISPNVIELSGIIKIAENTDSKEAYRKHLVEKYIK